MGTTRFRVSGHSFAAGELVFHTCAQRFATVAGSQPSKGQILILWADGRDIGAPFGADPSLLRRGVDAGKAYHDRLWRVSPDVAHLWRRAFAAGDDPAAFAAMLRLAAGVDQ